MIKNKTVIPKKIKFTVLFLIISGFIFGLIGIVLSIMRFGLVPFIPGGIALIFGFAAYFSSKKYARKLSLSLIGMSLSVFLLSGILTFAVDNEVVEDTEFEQEIKATEENIDEDLNEAFEDDFEFEDTDFEEADSDSETSENDSTNKIN